VGPCGAPDGLLVPGGAHVGRAPVAILLDQPAGVAAGDGGADGVARIVSFNDPGLLALF